MPSVIPKQPKKERDRITIRLDREGVAQSRKYCRQIKSSMPAIHSAVIQNHRPLGRSCQLCSEARAIRAIINGCL